LGERVPVLLLSFNRPDYLRPVLDSLAAQRLDASDAVFSLHFFQDGAVNRYSGVRYAAADDIAACIRLVRERFPDPDLHASSDNVGVSEMHARAEAFAFTTLGAEWAIFLEDDMVLDRRYLATMARMRAVLRGTDQVGYFAAYGDHRLPPDRLAEVAAAPQRWRPMEHLWSFGLTRAHWQAMAPMLEKYRALVHGRDYRQRPNLAVRRLFFEHGVATVATSQDAARTAATILCSRVRLNIELPLGRYIGESGVHFTPEIFRDLGYGAPSPLAPEGDILLRPPEEADLALARAAQSRAIESARATLGQRFGFRPVTRADVEALYRLLLDRDPESEAIYEETVGRQLLVNLRRAMIDSREFRGEN
jgi:hypothetical protein